MTPAQLLAWRRNLKLTQAGAADALGVHHDTYRQWETGRRRPSSLLERACLGVMLGMERTARGEPLPDLVP